jgi:hypothetical protein
MAYTTIDDPSAHFQTALWTGDGATPTIANDGNSDMQPDWLWGKNRTGTADHNYLIDTTRGTNKYMFSNSTSAEITNAAISSFNSDGFVLTSDVGLNRGSSTYVGWQWKANGGTRTTHTESGANPGGGFQSNTTAGFSIVDYVGTGGAGHVTHGLGAVPEFIIMKNRDEAESWLVYHVGIGNGKGLRLDTTAAEDTTANHWANTTPNSTTIVVGGNPPNNKDAINYIAYCFAPIQGYSKFGSYVGNANADGAFVYTGFKPAFVMLKGFNHAGQWVMQDTTRRNYQGDTKYVYANLANAEGTNSALAMDFLSNGFKLRSADDAVNSGDYIYMAFAEQPFVTSTGVPATAR